MFTVKLASADSRHECATIMDRIREEHPHYWPHGLSMDLFEGSGDRVYMVRSAANDEAVGFVGWQNREENDAFNRLVKVGYYAVGILPEHRRSGMAKEAVAKLIRSHRRGVDEVRALIQQDNVPSLKLAESLDVPVVKTAMSVLKKVLPPVMSGVGTAAIWDYLRNPDAKYPFDPNAHTDRWRWGNAGLNAVMGGMGHHFGLGDVNAAGRVTGEGMMKYLTGTAVAPLTKDTLVSLAPSLNKLPASLDKFNTTATEKPTLSDGQKTGLIAALGIGGLAVGAGAYGIGKSISNSMDRQGGPRVQVHLPTRHAGDPGATLDLPVGAANLTPRLQENLNRDLRRKLRRETNERTWHRGQPHLLGKDYPEEDDTIKAAAQPGGMLTAMPTKPIPTLQFASSIQPNQGMGKEEQEAQSAEHQKQMDSSQKSLESVQAELEKYKQQLQALTQQHQTKHLAAQEALMTHKQKAHELALENASLKANGATLESKLQDASNRPESPVDRSLSNFARQAKELHGKATSFLSKMASNLTPQEGAAGEAAYYQQHNPTGAGKALANFGFVQPGNTFGDHLYNAAAPQVAPGKTWTAGNHLQQWGANVLGTAGTVGNWLVSPFRYGARSAVRAGSHLSEGHIGKGLWEGVKGVGSTALGAATWVPGIGLGMGARALVGTASGIPEAFERPAAPIAPGATPSASGSPDGISDLTPDITRNYRALGNTGATHLLNRNGQLVPPGMVNDGQWYANATHYDHPMVGGLMQTAGQFLGSPKPPTSMAAYAASEGQMMHPEEARSAPGSPVADTVMRALYGN